MQCFILGTGSFSLFHGMERKVVQYVTASLTWKLCKLT